MVKIISWKDITQSFINNIPYTVNQGVLGFVDYYGNEVNVMSFFGHDEHQPPTMRWMIKHPSKRLDNKGFYELIKKYAKNIRELGYEPYIVFYKIEGGTLAFRGGYAVTDNFPQLDEFLEKSKLFAELKGHSRKAPARKTTARKTVKRIRR